VEGSSVLQVHNVDTRLDYETIQEAINANETLDGHSIHVDAGLYYENVVVNKSITLIGEDKTTTIIDGRDTGNVVHLAANNVTLTGFTIQDSDTYFSGIYANRTRGLNITNNIIEWNDLGITLTYSYNSIICENEVLRNWEGIMLEGGNKNTVCRNRVSLNKGTAIRITGDYNLVFENKLVNNCEDIVLLTADHNLVVSNEIAVINNEGITIYKYSCNNVIANNSLRALSTSLYPIGIDLIHNDDNIIIGNNISNFWRGMELYESNDNVISGNRVSNSSESGIFCSHLEGNVLIGNEISHSIIGPAESKVGIWLYHHCHKNTIVGNTVSSFSEFGIRLKSSSNNRIFHNNFINNTNQALATAASGNAWDDGYPLGGNYWSDYNGTDLYSGPRQNETGSDGIGDNPYFVDTDNQDNYPLTAPIPTYYHTLAERYNEMLSSYRDLNSTYHNLLASYNAVDALYNNLLSDYDNLQSVNNQLNASYATLQDSYEDLQSQQQALINELNTIKNLMYAFITTTIILVTATIYLARKQSKQKS